MSRLSNHIDTLLAFHDCVVIPTFGAIIKEQIAPRYCREDRVIYPAKKLLHFNKELRERDFLLEELYAQNYGISRRRARILVDQDVADFVSVLHRTGHGSLTAIGHFQLIDNGAIDFTPEVSSARFSSGDSYGLIPYHIPVALQEIQVVNASLQTLPQERENTDYIHFRLHKKAVAWAAAAVILVVCLLPVTYQPAGNYFTAGILPMIPQASTSIPSPKENSARTVSAVILSEGERTEKLTSTKKQADTEALSPPAPSQATPQSGYYVIIGAFRTEAKVLSFIESCRGASFASTVGYLQKGKKKFIYAVRRDTEQEARDFMHSLAQTDPSYKEVWVLHYTE